MYAVVQIEKFLTDNAERLGERAQEIRKRLTATADHGIIGGAQLSPVMGDLELANEFDTLVTTNDEYVQLGVQAIRDGLLRHEA